MNEQNTSQNDEEIKVSTDKSRLEEYKDLSGLTVKKLDFGLWWVLNAKFIKRTLFWFIASIGAISWLYTFINFGYYLTIGTNRDDQMLKTITAPNVKNNNYVAPSEIRSGDVQVFATTDSRYDLLATVSNPNLDYYVEFDYAFTLNGSTTQSHRGFILPNDQKGIISLGIAWPESVNSVGLVLSNVSWQRVDRHKIADWATYKKQHLAFSISEPQFIASESSGLSEKISVSEISFTLGNDTAYNYYQLPLSIYLYSFERVVGVYQARLDNLGSGEVRNVRLNYLGAVDKVDRISIVPDLDIMRQDIYFKFKGSD